MTTKTRRRRRNKKRSNKKMSSTKVIGYGEEPPLRLCQHCGGDPELVKSTTVTASRDVVQYFLRCGDCPMQTMKRTRVSAVVEIWNQRVGVEALVLDLLREFRALRADVLGGKK